MEMKSWGGRQGSHTGIHGNFAGDGYIIILRVVSWVSTYAKTFIF